jgi:sRNA-binding regulator protein Hfq
MEPANRRLIRPSLVEVKDQMNPANRRNAPIQSSNQSQQKKVIPPEQTNAENFYYLKQMQAKTPMIFVFQDGETIEGIIEWYDKNCLKIHREGEPNLLVYKPAIKYMYKVSG